MAECIEENNGVYGVCMKRSGKARNDTDGDTAENTVPVVWCGPLSKHYLPPASQVIKTPCTP